MATMADLIVQVRQRTDTVGSAFVTDQELEDYINDSIADLHCELLARWGEEFLTVEELVPVLAGDGDEDGIQVSMVPGIFAEAPLRFLSVSLWLPEDNRLVPLTQFARQDTIINVTKSSWRTAPPRYRIVGLQVIEFDSATDVARDVVVRVVPQPTRYDKDVATEIRELYAWREYVIVDASIKVLQKEESDTAHLDGRKQMLLARISANAPPRDVQAKTMIDGRALQELDWRSEWL